MLRTSGGVHNRRKKALFNLEQQLLSKTKNLSNSKQKELGGIKVIGLEESDIIRIKKEISILKTRV